MQSKIVNAGIDWLTMTTQEDTVGFAWYEYFSRRVRANKGNDIVQPWAALGYTGREYAGLRWGHSETNGYIEIASGAVADEVWKRTVMPPLVKVTRLDLAVTCQIKLPMYNVAREAYEHATDGPARQRKYTYITNSRGGSTLYVGSRQSGQYGRLYDKGAEQGKNAGLLWRYEVELKKPQSNLFAQRVFEEWAKNDRYWQQLIAYVHGWFSGRDVEPIFTDPGGDEIDLTPEFTITTANRKLAWLRTQVAPSIDKLIKAGLGQNTLRALGLDDDVLEGIATQTGLIIPPVDNEREK